MNNNQYEVSSTYSPWKQQIRRTYQPNQHSQQPTKVYHSNEQYQLLMEFELKRQKQKNQILQQRLKNKEIFIQQMKQFQKDLTAAFEKCQQQVNYYKKKLTFIQDVQVRQYVQQIADLKHKIIKMQTDPDKNNKSGKIFSSSRNKKQNQIKPIRSTSAFPSQTVTPHTKIINHLGQQIAIHTQKINNFISQFLAMAQGYLQNDKDNKLTVRLKAAWKWIKSVVKQWHANKIMINQYNQFHEDIVNLLEVDKETKLDEILVLLQEKIGYE